MSNKDDDINSLSHSKWRCHYHVVFAPKFRRQAIYGKIKTDIGKILRQLCEQKGIEIIEAELCPDHVHMLLAIPPKYSVAQIMGYLKGLYCYLRKEQDAACSQYPVYNLFSF